DIVCDLPDIKDIASKCDVVFLALPHTVSMDLAPKLLKAGVKVIDLSADYRIKDVKVYEKAYNCKHKDKDNIAQAVYGLPELYRERIKKAKLVANPGCYPTAAALALAPLVSCVKGIDLDSIIIDAKSGTTGAGKKASDALMFAEVNEDFKAYKVNAHQHAPEMNQELSKLAGRKLEVTFVPHLLPLDRGILETIYVKKTGGKVQGTRGKILDVYKKFYKKEPFVRVCSEGVYPRIKDVANTNYCNIAIKEEDKQVIIISAIDNLLKGASGQAVQNMNIMFGFDESAGLR
ncbi:MAG: N-acetyl-gamma-glutamyl-phosphate reductase, partial [Candidatus Omnitrophica bacterium]|nr:N-acetyl-gamma-glutamyl-phosphate reductase [Candidatus Omnitrophota bacterium]